MGEVTIDNFQSPVHSIDLSNDCKTYLASCLDNKIRIVDRLKG